MAKTFPILSFWVLIAASFEAYQKLFAEEQELIISIFLKWDTNFTEISSSEISGLKLNKNYRIKDRFKKSRLTGLVH